MSDSSAPGPKDGGWKWVYLIPMMALMIPIVAISNVDITAIATSATGVSVVTITAGTIAGRYLLGYRHQLRLAELEVQRDVVALEARQLTEAQRLLELDDRIDELRSRPETEPPATG